MLNEIRVGLFTASELSKLMSCEKKPDELPAGAMTYIYKKVAEELAEPKGNTLTTPAMEHGIMCEELAVKAFERKMAIDLFNTGDEQQTIVYDSMFSPLFGQIAGTPDALIINEFGETTSGVEIKCPDSHTHVFNIINLTDSASLKKHYPEYYWQIYGYALLTSAKEWYFASFDPRFHYLENQMHCINLSIWDEDIQFLIKRLTLAVQMKRSILEQLRVI